MTESASELIRLFRDVIYRDLFYVGGGCIILIGIIGLEKSLTLNLARFQLFITVVCAYLIGFCATDLGAQFKLINYWDKNPNRLNIFLYENFTHDTYNETWKDVFPEANSITWYHELIRVYDTAPWEEKSSISRITDLMQLGATFCPCVLFVVVYRAFLFKKKKTSKDSIVKWCLLVVLTFSLYSVNHVKSIQRTIALFNFYKKSK